MWPFIEKDFKIFIFQMDPNKSPSLDGINVNFNQQFWQIVGMDVRTTCLSFLNSKY